MQVPGSSTTHCGLTFLQLDTTFGQACLRACFLFGSMPFSSLILRGTQSRVAQVQSLPPIRYVSLPYFKFFIQIILDISKLCA